VRELPDHAAALAAAGFTRTSQHRSLGGLLASELWQLGEYTPAMLPPQHPHTEPVADPLPDPEPASPSLPGPDPGVYHREPGAPAPGPLGDGLPANNSGRDRSARANSSQVNTERKNQYRDSGCASMTAFEVLPL
jgi:hypothetical protein